MQLESSLGGDWKSGLAVDGTYVYVGDQHGHLAAVRKADGATTLYGVGAHDSAALSPVADQMGHVYWDESGTLDVINADGSGLRTTTPITVDGAVALDDTSVYVSSFDGSNHHIYRLCK